MIRKKAHIVCLFPLCRSIQHIFDKNAVAGGWVVYQNVGNRAYQPAVLNNGAAGHADVKCGTKEFCVVLRFLCVFAGKRQVLAHLTRDP